MHGQDFDENEDFGEGEDYSDSNEDTGDEEDLDEEEDFGDEDSNDEESSSDEEDSDSQNEDDSSPSPGYGPPLVPDHIGPIPSRPDHRDYQFKYRAKKPLGRFVDLRRKCPPVYNQKHFNSCTCHAAAGAFEFTVMKQGLPHFSPSRLFIWYNARMKTHGPSGIKKNVGTNLRDALACLRFDRHGVCSESEWPYNPPGEFNEKTFRFVEGARAAQKPTVALKQHAHQHTISKYFAFQKPNLQKKLIQCLDRGYPFVFGMKTYGLLSHVDSSGRGLSALGYHNFLYCVITEVTKQECQKPRRLKRRMNTVILSWR
jgi:hypothetical protein